MLQFSYSSRKDQIKELKDNEYELVIIGGGITGAGVAVQAAASGVKTALIEMQDFSEGTSSRSTKLVHGGIRYLKNFDLEVVSDTVQERAVVQNIAPHIPQPDPMLMPLYDEKDVTFNPMRLKVAMDLYDSLANVKNSKYANQMLSAEEVLAKQPNLSEKNLIAGGIYLDYNNNDSRLTIENIKQAANDGAVEVSRIKANGFEYTDNKISGVKVKDQLSGEEFTIKTKLAINTTGPWSDTVRELDEVVETVPQMRPTKGVHFVVDREKLPINQPTYVDSGEEDGRMVFILPREKKTYFGTTDTDFTGDFEHPTITQADLDYLLKIINNRFKDVNISIDDIESSWAGLRPLIDSNNASDYNGGDSGRLSEQKFDELVATFDSYIKGDSDRKTVEKALSSTDSSTSERGDGPSLVSRGSDLSQSDSQLITLAGGKLTDYRKMAEGALRLILPQLTEITGNKYNLVQSKTYPVSGGHFSPVRIDESMEDFANLAVARGFEYPKAIKLARLYGSNMQNVVALLPEAHDYAEQYNFPLEVAVSLLYSLEYEMTYTANDFFERRTTYLLFKRDEMLTLVDPVLNTIQDYFKLSDKEISMQGEVLQARIDESSLAHLR